MLISRSQFTCLLCAATVLVSACGGSKDVMDTPATPNATPSRIGGVETVAVTMTGRGSSRDDAIRDAVLRAVESIHGRAISVSTVRQEVGTVERRKGVSVMGAGASKTETERTTVGGTELVESTGGMVTSINIVSEAESRDGWTVQVIAAVAKFTDPGAGKPTVIITTPSGPSVTPDAARRMRQAMADGLTTSGKLMVLDRSNDEEIAAELADAVSGEVAGTEVLKAGKGKVADIAVLINIDQLGVNRTVRRMRMVDREIVSYSGLVEARYRLVHVPTRQVLGTGSARAERSSEESLQDAVDTAQWIDDMVNEVAQELARKAVADLLTTAGSTK